MYNLYSNYFQQSFNPLISQNFSFILKYEMRCQNCSTYYNFNYKNLLEFDVDNIEKIEIKLSQIDIVRILIWMNALQILLEDIKINAYFAIKLA